MAKSKEAKLKTMKADLSNQDKKVDDVEQHTAINDKIKLARAGISKLG